MRGSQARQCHSAGEPAVPRGRRGQRCESCWRKGEPQISPRLTLPIAESTSSLKLKSVERSLVNFDTSQKKKKN